LLRAGAKLFVELTLIGTIVGAASFNFRGNDGLDVLQGYEYIAPNLHYSQKIAGLFYHYVYQ